MKKKAILIFVIILGTLCLLPAPVGVEAYQIKTIKPPVIDGAIRSNQTDTYYWVGFFKFDISSIAGESLAKAELNFYVVDTGSACDGDVRLWRMDDQDWTTGNDSQDIIAINTYNETDYDSGYSGRHLNKWYTIDITDMVSFDHEASNTYTSIRLEDPDYLFTQNDGMGFWGSSFNVGYWNTATGFSDDTIHMIYDQVYGDSSKYAYLELYLESPGPESLVGETLSLSIQPDEVVPTGTSGFKRGDTPYDAWNLGYSDMMENDDERSATSWSASSNTYVNLFWENSYWKNANYITYDLDVTSENTWRNITLHEFTPTRTQINTENTTSTCQINGSHQVGADNWYNGHLEVQIHVLQQTSGWIYANVDQLTLNFTAISKTVITDRKIVGTTVFDVFTWDVLEYNDTLTLTEIPTTYTLDHIEGGDCDTNDTISSDGTLILTNTTKGRYRVFLDVQSSVHRVHFAHSYPDGLGTLATWDEVKWFLNDTQVEHNDYYVFNGTYDLDIYDYFDQLIVDSETLTLETTDSFLQRYEIELPLYIVSFVSKDDYVWRLLIERNDIVREYPVPPRGEIQLRLYGLASNVDYNITIVNPATSEVQDNYTMSVPNYPTAKQINYKLDDDKVIVQAPQAENTIIMADIEQSAREAVLDNLPFIIIAIALGVPAGIAILKRDKWRGRVKTRKELKSTMPKSHKRYIRGRRVS